MSGIEIAGHRIPGWAPVAALGVAGGLLLLRARSASAGSNPLAGAGLTAADLAGGVGPPLPGMVSPAPDAGPGGAGVGVPTGTPVFDLSPPASVGLTPGAGGVGTSCFEPWLYPPGSPCNPRGVTRPPALIGPGPSRAG